MKCSQAYLPVRELPCWDSEEEWGDAIISATSKPEIELRREQAEFSSTNISKIILILLCLLPKIQWICLFLDIASPKKILEIPTIKIESYLSSVRAIYPVHMKMKFLLKMKNEKMFLSNSSVTVITHSKLLMN